MGRSILALAAVLLGAGLAAAGPGAPGFAFNRVSVQLGVRLTETTAQLREALGVEADRGALVLEVEPKGPAHKAGLRAGDVLTRIAGKPVGDAADVFDALDGHEPGDEVPVDYVRGGKAASTRVALARARGSRMRLGRWSFQVPGFELPPDVEQELRRFQERVERQLKELDQRLRRLEGNERPDRTGLGSKENGRAGANVREDTVSTDR
jgi:PDZ domain